VHSPQKSSPNRVLKDIKEASNNISYRLNTSLRRQRSDMGEVVNLRVVRKRVKRAQKDARADARRTEFGISKAERKLRNAETERANHTLDQHRLSAEDK